MGARNANLRTINGEKKTRGIVRMNVQIFETEEEVDLVVIDEENFDHDVLIGLDMIKKFKLIQDEKLKITQRTADQTGDKEDLNEERESQNLSEEKFLINFNEHMEQENFKIGVGQLDS